MLRDGRRRRLLRQVHTLTHIMQGEREREEKLLPQRVFTSKEPILLLGGHDQGRKEESNETDSMMAKQRSTKEEKKGPRGNFPLRKRTMLYIQREGSMEKRCGRWKEL